MSVYHINESFLSVEATIEILIYRAVKAGVCGVPSYQVNNGAIIWGQDRLNIVADLLCGWKDPLEEQMNSKL